MNQLRAGLFLLALGSLALAGCKKADPPPAPTPTPTSTPIPEKDVLGFTRGGTLWTMRWDGKDPAVLVQLGKGSVWFPVPAPSGDHFLAWLSRPEGGQNIVRIDLSRRITELTAIDELARPEMKNIRLGNAPAYSPDGKRIAYSFNGNIWVMDANGYNAETLIADGASWSPAWSPDGKRLAYVNGRNNRFDLWVAMVDSHDTWQVTDFSSYSVGQPRWTSNGMRIMITRSQKDESDVVTVLADTETALADGDAVTNDRQSAAAVFDPGYGKVLFSSARGNGQTWEIWVADSNGSTISARKLTEGGGLSPAWLRPSTATAGALDMAGSRPTPIVPKAEAQVTAPATTAGAATGGAKAAQAMAATPSPAQAAMTYAVPIAAATPMPATPVPTAVAAAPAPATAVPSSDAQTPKPATPPAAAGLPSTGSAATRVPATAPQAVVAATAPKPVVAPTQPPLKAAPLRLRFKASFDDKDALALASLSDLKGTARRVKQYSGETVTIYGPLDRSALRGRYASDDARSKARAQKIADQLAKDSGLDPSSIKALPYTPPAAGPANSIQIYVELK